MKHALFTVAALPMAALMATTAYGQSAPLTGDAAFGDFSQDAPGVTRHITSDDLAAPGATESASNAPGNIDRPAAAMPKVPDGFSVELVATGIANPRAIEFAPNGDLFVPNSSNDEVLVYRWSEGSTEPQVSTFAAGLTQPYGIAFYPPGPNPEWVYIGNSDSVVRFAYKSGDTKATGAAETVVPSIPSTHHWTRDIAFSPDGKTLYVAVGSGSNVGTDGTMDATPKDTSVEDWAANHPLGVSWGEEERRAAVLAFNPDGSNERYFATGLRNCAGLEVQPQTGDVWCVVNERDELGDNVPFDYATHVEEGAFYGWPWFYIGNHPDPRWARTPRADIADKVTVPDVLFQAHSAPLNITFYEGDKFGPDYAGDAFVAMHGSWNRGTRTGYKVVRLPIDDSRKATGEYQDFMTGFVLSADGVWGRPVGVAEAPDGALFVSEDGNGTIWRVTKSK